ncbi:MAG: putative toxin-antitoxin system toxin component, PIN family [Gemmatimonadota bacterium]
MRVFLDTNVLVSAFATRGLSSDVVHLVLAEHELVTGETNLSELRRVLQDRIGLPHGEVRAVEELIRGQTVVPRPDQAPEIEIRDPDDRWVLASAIAGAADILVTGDKDLLSVAEQFAIPIVNPRGFWERVRREPG